MLWYLVLRRVIVFFSMIRGWRRNNKYSLMGILRRAARTIRYEATFIFCILLLSITYSTFNFNSFFEHKDWFAWIIFPIILISMLAELHRTPFDFSERERELVRGYNTEYRGKSFAFLFLGEYSMLLFNSILLRVIFIGINNMFVVTLSTLGFTVLFTNIRVTLCRYRYDLLIETNWKLLLPVTIYLVIIFSPIYR